MYVDEVYIDQSASDLRLHVIGGRLDLSQFTLLRSGGLDGPDLRVRAGIIGASHVLAIQRGDEPPLHEVFACTDLHSDAQTERLYSGAVTELPAAIECEPAGLGYCFRSRVTHTEGAREELARLEARIARVSAGRQPGQLGLEYEFPALPDGEAPKTLVWLGLDSVALRVRVETAHYYPNEGTIVFSETRVDVEPGER